VTLRIGASVLAFFKAQGHQTLINQLLHKYMGVQQPH